MLSKLCLVGSLCLFGSNAAQAALSAVTANTIEGTKPYLELSDGTVLTDLNGLLGFSMPNPDGSATNVQVDVSMVGTDIIIPAGMKFSDVKASIAADGALHNLSTAGVKVGDADGDVSTLNPGTVTGKMKATWYDKNNVQITNLNQTLSVCDNKSPYKLKIEVDGGTAVSANTTYGAPRTNPYTGAIPDATYTFKLPAGAAGICYAKPDMMYATGRYAGPLSEWNPSKGFLAQSSGNNFPTTGADGLYFDLDVAGIDADSLTWPVVTKNGITATMSNITSTSVRVTLTGPAATAAQKAAANPGAIAKPGSSQFVIAGKLGGTTKVSYPFTIKNWYINRGSTLILLGDMSTWCNGAGYRLPHINELTNATGTATGDGGTIPPGGTSSGNWYQRRIGGGLFSEWGDMSNYTDASFVISPYWASGTVLGREWAVNSGSGTVITGTITITPPSSHLSYGLCMF